MVETPEIKNVAIIGCGSIGASWAALFAAHGLQVAAFDIKPEAEAFLHSLIADALPTLAQLGQTSDDFATIKSRVRFTTDLSTALRDADFVQENGPERLDFKQQLFNDLAAHIRPDVIIATSSSGLTCSSIQGAVHVHPERCVVGHPFNPPHLIPLVEVVGGAQTSPEVVARTMAFYNGLGKRAVHVRKEVPGHIANRLQAALVREMLHLVQDDVCKVKDIEDAMQYGPGLRWGVMGPNTLLHLGGGPGGIEHMSNHLLKPLTGWWAPEDPRVDEELRVKWTKGTLEAVGEAGYEELARKRDGQLIELLRIRKEYEAGEKN